jgi:L-fuculose-phosphate aldolase
MKDRNKRQSIIDACLRMNALGINQGTSGNISLRHGDGMLITPTSTPYEAMKPEQIVYMHLDGNHDPAAIRKLNRLIESGPFHVHIARSLA